MFEGIQRKYMGKMVSLAIVCFLFAAGMVAPLIKDISLFMKVQRGETVDLNCLTASQIQNGLYVEGEIDVPVGQYIDGNRDGIARHWKYLIAIGEQKSVILSLACREETKTALALQENMRIDMRFRHPEVPENTLDLWEDIKPIRVCGVVRPMSVKSEISLFRYLQTSGLTLEEKERCLCYELVEGEDGDIDLFDLYTGIMSIVMFLFLGIYCIVRGATRRNLNGLKYYCEEQGDLKYGLMQMERFYKGGVREQGLRINDDFFLMIAGTKVYFAQTAQILWIYPDIVRHRRLLIPLGTSYALKVKKVNGTEIKVPVRNEQILEKLLEYITSRVLYIVIGYNEHIEHMYAHNRRKMIQIVEQRRQNQLGRRGQTTEQQFAGQKDKFI